MTRVAPVEESGPDIEFDRPTLIYYLDPNDYFFKNISPDFSTFFEKNPEEFTSSTPNFENILLSMNEKSHETFLGVRDLIVKMKKKYYVYSIIIFVVCSILVSLFTISITCFFVVISLDNWIYFTVQVPLVCIMFYIFLYSMFFFLGNRNVVKNLFMRSDFKKLNDYTNLGYLRADTVLDEISKKSINDSDEIIDHSNGGLLPIHYNRKIKFSVFPISDASRELHIQDEKGCCSFKRYDTFNVEIEVKVISVTFHQISGKKKERVKIKEENLNETIVNTVIVKNEETVDIKEKQQTKDFEIEIDEIE